MRHKNILLVSLTTRLHSRMRDFASVVDVSIAHASAESFSHVTNSGVDFDLIIVDLGGMEADLLADVRSYAASKGNIPQLLVIDLKDLASLHMPPQGRNDFVLASATVAEIGSRCSLLLWPGEQASPADIVTVDDMTINLATYQVCIKDTPVDLTLMEYSLLSFLVTHPSRAYSRETLLHRVWGFEYCGGTRTVDVHIRRVRSKVGPQVASHIVTIRGVGYLFRV